MGFYRLTTDDVLVVLDDVALPTGKIRLRPGGSSGGHNGLKDIERMLGTSQYRACGSAWTPRRPRAQRDYVLGRLPRSSARSPMRRSGGRVTPRSSGPRADSRPR